MKLTPPPVIALAFVVVALIGCTKESGALPPEVVHGSRQCTDAMFDMNAAVDAAAALLHSIQATRAPDKTFKRQVSTFIRAFRKTRASGSRCLAVRSPGLIVRACQKALLDGARGARAVYDLSLKLSTRADERKAEFWIHRFRQDAKLCYGGRR